MEQEHIIERSCRIPMVTIARRRGGEGEGEGAMGRRDRKRPGSAPRSALDRIRGFPGPRQQLVDAVYGVSIDHAREHVMQVGVGLDVIKLAALCRPPNYA